MAKRGRKPNGHEPRVRATERVGLYIRKPTRNRLNWLCTQLGSTSQDAAIATALDAMGVPADVPEQQAAQ